MKDGFLLLPSVSSKKNNSWTLDLNDKFEEKKIMKCFKMCANEKTCNFISFEQEKWLNP